MAIIDTGAETSFIASSEIPGECIWRPWRTDDGAVVDGNNRGFRCLAQVALEDEIGPLEALAQFSVVQGMNFQAFLGGDFLYAHELRVCTSRHFLIFVAHDRIEMSLMGLNPRNAKGFALLEDT